jgi:hypothetical protein
MHNLCIKFYKCPSVPVSASKKGSPFVVLNFWTQPALLGKYLFTPTVTVAILLSAYHVLNTSCTSYYLILIITLWSRHHHFFHSQMRLTKVKYLAQGHTAGKEHSQDLKLAKYFCRASHCVLHQALYKNVFKSFLLLSLHMPVSNRVNSLESLEILKHTEKQIKQIWNTQYF